MTIQFLTSWQGHEFGSTASLGGAEAGLIADGIARAWTPGIEAHSDVPAVLRFDVDGALLGVVVTSPNDGAQAVIPLGGENGGTGITKATTDDATTGTDDARYMTPAKVKAAIDTFAAEGGAGASNFSELGGVPSDNAALNAALAARAPLVSPALSGTPSAPTPPLGNNSTRIATMAAIAAAIANLLQSAPGALDTLGELATALGNDANFAASVTNALAARQPISADLSAIASLATAANKLAYSTGPQTWALTSFTAAARTLNAAADQAAQRTALGLGSVVDLAPADLPVSNATTAAITAATSDKAVIGRIVVTVLSSSRSLTAADIGTLIEQRNSTPHLLTIPPVAAMTPPLAWQDGKHFFLGSRGTGAVTFAAGTIGVSFENGTLSVVQGDAPLMFRMTETLDVWAIT